MSVLGRLQQSLVPSNFQAAAAVRLGGGDGDGLDVLGSVGIKGEDQW